MRGAARQPEEEPAPERADLDAKAARLLDERLAVMAEVRAVLRSLPAAACDPRLAAPVEARLKQCLGALFDSGVHDYELREELARYTAANAGGDSFFAMGRAYERSLQAAAAKAAIPAPRHRHRARWQPGDGQRALFSVKTIPGIAAAALVALRPLAKGTRHAVTHPAAIRLTAHTARVAAGAVTGAGVAATAAVLVLAPGVTHGQPGAPATGAASVPGWHTSASPIPSTSLIARTVTRPKPKHGSKKQLMSASGLPLPCCVAGPEPSASASASSSPSPVVSVQAGPATLSVSATSLDLSLIPQAVFTVSATGSGWVSWRISTTGNDLDFSQDHGVLQAGESVTVTVSLAASLDALTAQVFEVDGQQVTVTLPLPVPVPSVSPTSVIPSGVLPSL